MRAAGLRWRDVDWAAQRIRVRQHATCAASTPPTASPTLDAPLGADGRPPRRRAGRLVAAHDSTGELDLVFAHPHTGRPSTRTRSPSASSRRAATPASRSSASTTCATPSRPAWRRPASADAGDSGVPGPRGCEDDADLRPLRAVSAHEVDMVNQAFASEWSAIAPRRPGACARRTNADTYDGSVRRRDALRRRRHSECHGSHGLRPVSIDPKRVASRAAALRRPAREGTGA